MWLDYFVGGVPTGEYFLCDLRDCSELIERSSKGISRANEICFIGMLSYFEAFCKGHFASILNIEPTLLTNLRQKSHDILIDPLHLLGMRDEWAIRLGFLVAEKYDFGTPQKIAALYNALLKVTPFSKSEAQFYQEMLRDRNLLVQRWTPSLTQ